MSGWHRQVRDDVTVAASLRLEARRPRGSGTLSVKPCRSGEADLMEDIGLEQGLECSHGDEASACGLNWRGKCPSGSVMGRMWHAHTARQRSDIVHQCSRPSSSLAPRSRCPSACSAITSLTRQHAASICIAGSLREPVPESQDQSSATNVLWDWHTTGLNDSGDLRLA